MKTESHLGFSGTVIAKMGQDVFRPCSPPQLCFGAVLSSCGTGEGSNSYTSVVIASITAKLAV